MIKNTIKNCILSTLLLISYGYAHADVSSSNGIFGASISPNFSHSSVNSDDSSFIVNSKNSAFNIVGGINYNHIINPDKYFYSVGVSLGTETFSIENNPVSTEKKQIDEVHNLMYLYISPIGFTLNTDEIGVLDLSAFFSVSFVSKFLINFSSKAEAGFSKYVKDFNKFGIDLNLKCGLKYAVGPNTSLHIGIDWWLSFMNAIANHEKINQANVIGKTGAVGLYLGIWF